MARGGERTPNNPAPTSGPGALSQRTDGSPSQPKTYIPDMRKDGVTSKEVYASQGQADMYSDKRPTPSFDISEIVPLMSPSGRPNDPITNGVPIGIGENYIPNRPTQSGSLLNTMETLIRFDPTGDAELIAAQLRDAGIL